MTDAQIDRRRMTVAFTANIVMFIAGLIGWYLADSAALLADALDMLADASGYIVAWIAVGKTLRFQQYAARWNGAMLIALGAGVLIEVAHRFLSGGEPQGLLILAFAILSLIVNGSVLAMLSVYRDSDQVHLRATWVDTRADLVVNAGVLLSGALIAILGYRQIDWIVGLAIGIYVIREGMEIWEDADERMTE